MRNAPSTDESTETSEEPSLISIAELENKIKMLSPDQQKILTSYCCGYTVTEIAEMTNLPTEYITKTIKRYLYT